MCAGSPVPSRSALGAYLAEAARLEAASAYAFRQLVKELEALDAPVSLIVAARAALADELTHAAAMSKLAARHGATVSSPELHDAPLRAPFAMALENAAEGCVRETFGALVAWHQAAHAEAPRCAI